MSDSIGDHRHIHTEVVEPTIVARLSEEHSESRPGIPFSWILSYYSKGALQNIRYFENGVRHCKLEFPIRVFMSEWTSAILVSFVPPEAVNEPHVKEWLDSFFEVPVEEAKRRLTEFPDFPYNGKNPDLHRADLIASGGHKEILRRSRERLKALGLPIS